MTRQALRPILALVGVAPLAAAAEPSIWPIPREAALVEERLLLTEAAIVVPEGDRRDQFPGRLLAELIQDQFGVALPVAVGSVPTGRTPIVVAPGVPGDPGPEGYVLNVEADGVRISGSDYRGTLYGVSSFVQLVHRWGHRSIAAWKGRVRDWPALPVRWVHVYLPGRDALPFARRYLRDFLLRYKFNGLVLEVGGGMRLDSHPEISVGWRRTVAEWYAHGETIGKLKEGIPLGAGNRFAASCHFGVGGGAYVEKDDVRRLAQLAEDYGLEIVPEIQGLSHAYYIASARRDLAEVPEMPWPDSYCPSNPESYRVLFDVMDEYLEVLRPKRVHIGHDEWRAGAFCARCRGRDPGQLFAEDVLRIRRHLVERGIEVWMWGDHFVDGHNRFGKSWSEGSAVRYERPDTASARERIAAEARDLHILNWSGEEGDRTFMTLGWPFAIGNFEGSRERDWQGRVTRGGALGGEVSSWGALEEFQIGKLQVPEALFSIGLLWSPGKTERGAAFARVAQLLPEVRGRLAARPLPSVAADPMRFERLDIGSAFNHPPRGEGWDLSNLKPHEGYADGLPYALADPARRGGRSCVVVTREAGEAGNLAELPLHGRWASLVFLQSATAAGRPSIHAGDATHFPAESSELLGYYEIRFADGLTAVHAIRYDEDVLRWDAGLGLPPYFARAVVAGRLPDGREAVLWGSEWANPRPDVPIVSVRMVGSPGASAALPVLFGVTAVEKPRVEDYR